LDNVVEREHSRHDEFTISLIVAPGVNEGLLDVLLFSIDVWQTLLAG
jgi:hypothetical protein